GYQPVISPNYAPTNITVIQTLNTGGAGYTTLGETQIDGVGITLTNGADLTIQGVAMGIFYANKDTLTPNYGTMSGLHGALTATPTADMHMQISVIGTDTLTVDTVNENFGFITIGNTDTLTINNVITGGNAQQLHGLINYGEISISAGGELNITDVAPSGSTVANFYNAGWIVDNGGTLNISSSVLDGASTQAPSGGVDGFIELGQSANAILSGTVGTSEQVNFTDNTANTLQITAGTLFSGTVNNFGSSDTILVNGFTSTSNATLTTVGGVTELITANGAVLTTITLTGSITSNITTGTNSSGQEFIINGGTTAAHTTYTSGGNTLSSGSGTLANTSTVTVTGSGTSLAVTSTVTGTGSFLIDYGATLALDNPTGNDAGQTVTFGTHGSTTAPNTLLINDNSSGFGGTVTGFGVNDAIILGASALPTLPANDGVALSYSGTGDVLTISETNASGGVVSSSTVTVIGTAALATGSFVAEISTLGIVVESAAGLAGHGFTFAAGAGKTASFESPTPFGGTAPGDIIAAGETVTISTGTASVSGNVADNGTISVLSGAGFTDAHSLTGTGTLAVAAGGAASLTGNTTLGTITDAGTLALGGTDAVAINITGAASIASTFSDSQAITGTGALTIGSGITATLAAGSSVASVLDNGTLNLAGAMGGSINMEGNNANTVADFLGSDVTGNTLNTSFTNLGFGDKIILGGANFALSGSADVLTESYSGGVLTVTDTTSHATVAVNVSLTAGDAASLIHVTDNTGALVITLCFYPGTALATPEGTILVEDIKPGDMLMTANGAKPVRWIGQSHIHTRFADPLRSLPIRIRQGALGDGLPQRDLLLSPDHAIHVDGILVQASALVNGSSIIRDYDVPESFTYYHVELDSHELLLAEGVDAESFVDNVDRMHFHNWEDRMAPEAAIMEMDLPRAKSARQVPASIRRRLGLDQMAVA
uniref:Hint domain-containing protein n=1 Tax=Acidocella sp. TaxID=50710 RepID=UPI00263940EA